MGDSRQKDTVLVVDDDPDWQAIVADALDPCYAVVSALTGKEGIRIASTTPLSAIVLDVLMTEGEDGFMVLCELRKGPSTRDIPVVLFSNVNTKTQLAFTIEDMRILPGTGPDAFLEKPSSAETILRTVNEVIAHRRPHSSP